MAVKFGKFGKFLACTKFPECRFAKKLQKATNGKCNLCGGQIMVKTSKNKKTYYGCENSPQCGFMTWDVPTAEDCPKCGQTMFKKSGRGRMKAFCINEACENFLPEDKRGYYKKAAKEQTEEKPKKTKTAKKSSKK